MSRRDEPDVAERVVSGPRQRRDVEQQRVGRRRIAWRALAKRDWARQTRPGQLGLHANVDSEESREIAGGNRATAAAHDDANAGGDVLGNDGAGRIRRGGQSEQREFDLTDLAQRRLRAHDAGHADEVRDAQHRDKTRMASQLSTLDVDDKIAASYSMAGHARHRLAE